MSNRQDWLVALSQAMMTLAEWEGQFAPAQARPPNAQDKAALHELALRLHGNYPFGSPDYAGQMLKPPDPMAWAAIALAMLVNPNNHALDGGRRPLPWNVRRSLSWQVCSGFLPTVARGWDT